MLYLMNPRETVCFHSLPEKPERGGCVLHALPDESKRDGVVNDAVTSVLHAFAPELRRHGVHMDVDTLQPATPSFLTVLPHVHGIQCPL